MSEVNKLDKLSKSYFKARANFRKNGTEVLKEKMITARHKYIVEKQRVNVKWQ